MKKIIFNRTFLLTIMLNLFVFSFLIAQGDGGDGGGCKITKISHSFKCDDNGTPNYPNDDTYTIKAFFVNSATNSFWHQMYGPFAVGTNQHILAVDPMNSTCNKDFYINNTPSSCEGSSGMYWNDCISLMASDDCTHTFLINIEGDGTFTSSYFFNMKLEFDIFDNVGGIIKDAYFFDGNGYMANMGVHLNISDHRFYAYYLDEDEPLDGDKIVGNQIIVEIEAENIPSCFIVSRTNYGNYVKETPTELLRANGDCDPFQVCTEGGINVVTGKVIGFNNALTPCPGTEELGIMGAEISITGNDESCITKTLIDGSYECDLGCDDGPYDVCVTTTCIDEPCGLDPLDVVLMRQAFLSEPQCWETFMGDVNGDGVFSTLDINIVAKELLGLNNLPIDWCRFVPLGDYLDCCQVGNCQYNSIDNCINVQNASNDIWFIRFIKGDFNGGCNDCVYGDGQGPFPLVMGGSADGKIDFKLPTIDTLYSLTLDINIGDNISLSDISCGLPNAEYVIDDNRLKLIWFDATENNAGFITNPNTPFMTIRNHSETPITLSEKGNYILSSQQGIKSLVVDNSLSFREAKAYSLSVDNNLCNVELKGKDKNVRIEIFNINGVSVYNNNHNFDSGFVNIDSNILKTGIYLVRIQNKENNITKKIFINK